jgi:hypothetical protein
MTALEFFAVGRIGSTLLSQSDPVDRKGLSK